MIFLSLFLVPLLLSLFAYVWFGSKISPKELALVLAVEALIVGVLCLALRYSNTWDTEIWNGRIAAKSSVRVSCEHSYPCNCRPVSCGKNCTTVHCDTCYDHSYDIDWNAGTTNGEGITISRVDRQGLSEPPRWTSIAVGDPTSIAHSYENYIKAAPDTLFHGQGDIKEEMPAYPLSVYDYYRLDHLVQFVVSISTSEVKAWNAGLAQINGDLGHSKQVNMVVVLVKNKPHDWFRLLERRWIGGKKNDAVVVIGLDGDDSKIMWTEVMAWTDYSYFKIQLRDDILTIGKLDRESILAAISKSVSSGYKRKHMEDFKYLLASIVPTPGEYAFGLFISIAAAVGMLWFVEENDVFDDEDQEEQTMENFFRRVFGKKPKKMKREAYEDLSSSL